MKIKQSTIKFSKRMQEELLKERITPRESYEEIVSRLLKFYREHGEWQ